MNFSSFALKAIELNRQNKFEKCNENINIVPDDFKEFYRNYNPVDVEIEIDNAIVRFYPVINLSELQVEFSYINAQFIFASCNGDPIFYEAGKIYTCPHGVKDPA